MKQLIVLITVVFLLGCAAPDSETGGEYEETPIIVLNVEPPELMAVPEPVTVKSDTDWKGKAHNKEIEVIQVVNILLPVKAYLVEGFTKFGSKCSATTNEDWEDTQAQLTSALGLYGKCVERKKSGEVSKQLFLDLEETWQLLVKTGVSGIRTKQMLDEELKKIAAKM